MNYQVAGQDIFISCPVFELTAYRAGEKEAGEIALSGSTFSSASSGTALAHAKGWVGDAEREVELHPHPEGFIMKVDGAKEIFISSQGDEIILLNGTDEPTWLDRQVIAGPGLVFALARRGQWCLHASAALFKDRLHLFLGESGEGKSTLAAFLEGQENWKRVADDILPITLEANGLTAWPHFPQLKLPPESQPGLVLDESLPVGCIHLLKPLDAEGKPGVELLPEAEAAKTLLAQTAGARLFTADMLASHLDFCTRAAGQVPVYGLQYPRNLQALPVVMKLLEAL